MSKDKYKSINQILRGWLNSYNGLAPKQALYGIEYEVVSCVFTMTGDICLVEGIQKIFSKCINENT